MIYPRSRAAVILNVLPGEAAVAGALLIGFTTLTSGAGRCLGSLLRLGSCRTVGTGLGKSAD